MGVPGQHVVEPALQLRVGVPQQDVDQVSPVHEVNNSEVLHPEELPRLLPQLPALQLVEAHLVSADSGGGENLLGAEWRVGGSEN